MEPDVSGFVERDGVNIYYEVFGKGETTVLLFPPWQLVHSRAWKGQLPYLARHYRVVTFDVRGSGKSDRPAGAKNYLQLEVVRDAVAVLDATGTDRAVVVGWSLTGVWAPLMAAEFPERVTALAVLTPLVASLPWEAAAAFGEPRERYDEGLWDKFNMHYWRAAPENFRDFVETFFNNAAVEPHSTKQVEDAIGWGLENDPEILIDTILGAADPDNPAPETTFARVRCPSLLFSGTADNLTPPVYAETLAEAIGARIVDFGGSGHMLGGRDPVKVNLVLREFIDSVSPPSERKHWARSMVRPKKALFISSPIGLGHSLRDLAVAEELRRLQPDLQIDWLSAHPVTEVLERQGERVHPASAFLANESAHLESETSGGHDLNCFQVWRDMDEILVHNFMVFHELISAEPYDIVVGDESWDVDHFLHENPELKRSEFVWMTDFVGWLPMPEGGDREVRITADYNVEMMEHVARFPQLRNRSIFVGNPDDIVPDRLGPGLPTIREWTEANYDFAGYINGLNQDPTLDREALRAEFGYRPDEAVCIATVGGTATGTDLLRRVIAAYPFAKELVPGLRLIVVAGPRIDPASLPAQEGLEVRPYVHGLYRHLAACDLAVVQGGLSTAMELTVYRRPFLYFPLKRHFEQRFHVRHRLDRYRAGQCMDYDGSPPEVVAKAMAAELSRPLDYRPVETDGAARAAALISELL
jgi:pimeloyl-ACP methyl ester carboxylesterase/predicted glycosyltransferase